MTLCIPLSTLCPRTHPPDQSSSGIFNTTCMIFGLTGKVMCGDSSTTGIVTRFHGDIRPCYPYLVIIIIYLIALQNHV